MDYGSLAAVAAVIREGSFEGAAARLNVTPSAVSQRVRALEERLGLILVSRGQPCRPTEAGARLCAHLDHVRLLESELATSWPALVPGRPGMATTLRLAVNADSLGTWFMPAAAAFSAETGCLLDLVLDDEQHTADRLRSGDVLAAITADPAPVQGCRTRTLGQLQYAAVASPAFLARYRSDGSAALDLARMPVLAFDRRDKLQERWARKALGSDLAGPTHWVPSTQGFVDATLAGLAWGMNPLGLIEHHLASGRLIELVPGQRLDIGLYWQHARIGADLLGRLTHCVVEAARTSLLPVG